VEVSGVGLDHYAQVLQDKRIQHGWKYGNHYMPHDIKHGELTTGRSRLQALTGAPKPNGIVVGVLGLLSTAVAGYVRLSNLNCERGA
jgi:hypothetical protein